MSHNTKFGRLVLTASMPSIALLATTISPGWIKDSVLNIAKFWRVDSSIKSWNRLEKELDGYESAEPCGFAFTNV
jgi:hypothetical protein